MAWLYLPGTEASSSESTPPSEAVVPWVTLSGKAMQRPLSWRGWENRPYIRLLSGTTLPPSTAARGAESWISSLRASRANRSAWQGHDEAPPTSAGSGTTLSESFARFSHDGSLVKTSLDLFLSDSTPYSDRLPASGMMLAGELFELTRWEPAIDASGSLFSQGWPTPAARDHNPTNKHPSERPQAAGRKHMDQLPNFVQHQWPTPNARDEKNATELGSSSNQRRIREGWTIPLNDRSVNWPTPDANCWKGGTGTEPRTDKSGKVRTSGRDGQLSDASSPPALQISSCGPGCSTKHRRLNPAFVEWLMGLPSGWTIARIGSGPAATELYHYRQQLQSECSRIARAGS